MAIYMKRRIPVDAEQYIDRNNPPRGVLESDNGNYYVTTIQDQKVNISLGEWIVDEGDGIHFYPIKDEVFQKTYEQDIPPPARGNIHVLSLEVVAQVLQQVETEALVGEIMRRHAEQEGIVTPFDGHQLVAFLHRLVETNFGCMACANEGGENFLKDCDTKPEEADMKQFIDAKFPL